MEENSQAEADRLKRKIVEIQAETAELKRQNSLLEGEKTALQSKTLNLEVEKEEEALSMRTTYEDLLEDMKSEIEKGQVTITQLKGKLKVNMVDEILFDSGKTTIKAQGVEVLERVGKTLSGMNDKAISIEGHTDDVPIGAGLRSKYPTNWELSVARAAKVARYLQEKVGVDPGSLSAAGYGEYHPIASNETEEGRAKNRRIEIVLVPKEITPVSRK